MQKVFFRIDLQFVMFTFQKIYITMPYVMCNVMKKTSETSPLSFEIYIKDNYFHIFIDGLGLNLSNSAEFSLKSIHATMVGGIF